jgi:hypothetical protein
VESNLELLSTRANRQRHIYTGSNIVYYVSNLKREENSGQNFGASVYKDKQKKTFTQAVMQYFMSLLVAGAI